MDSEKNLDKKRKPGNFCYDFVKATGALPALLILRPKVFHLGSKDLHSPKGGVLIMCNHVNFSDPILLHCVFLKRRIHSLATEDLFRSPRLSAFFSLMHCIKVNKKNFSFSAFHEITDRLRDGKAVLIFPEGEVNLSSSELLSFKSGIALMAHRSGAPILPVYAVKRKNKYERRTVVVGDPIDVRAICGDTPSMTELSKAIEYIRERELQLESYYREHILKNER